MALADILSQIRNDAPPPVSLPAPLRQLALSTFAQLGNTLLSPLTRVATHESNYQSPSNVPDPHSVIHLAYQGKLNWREVRHWLRYHAIDPGDGQSANQWQWRVDRQRLWSQIIVNSRPIYSMGDLRKWWRQGRITEDQVREAVSRHGFSGDGVDDPALWLADYEIPSAAAVIHMWLLGILPEDDALRLLQQGGMTLVNAARALQAVNIKPGIGETLDLLNRGQIDEAAAHDYMRSAGITDETIRRNHLALRFQLPGAGALITSGARQAFNDLFAQRWGLDNERHPYIDQWTARLGLDFPLGAGGTLTQVQAAWRDHWQVMPLGLLAQVLHRVRGNVGDPATWSIPGLQPLSSEEVQDVLAANGVAPGARDYVSGLIYAPLSIRHIRLTADSDDPRVTKDWITGKLLDGGMSPADADLIADITIVNADTKKIKSARSKFLGTVLQAYRIGATDRGEAESALLDAGTDPRAANFLLQQVELEQNAEVIKAVTRRAKADYFAGRTSLAGARVRLVAAGINVRFVDITLVGWQAERGEGRIHLATSRILSLLRKGYLTYDESLQRLDNLGWARPDELLLLAEVEGEIAKDAAAAAALAGKNAAKIVRGINEVAKNAEASTRKLRAALKQATPVSSIKRWVERGLWTVDDAKVRLRLMGFDEATIETLVKDWEYDLISKASKASSSKGSSKKSAGGSNVPPAAPPAGGTGG